MKTSRTSKLLMITVLGGLLIAACQGNTKDQAIAEAAEPLAGSPQVADRSFTLKTIVNDGGLAYIGVGGEIDGVINPDLAVQPGDVVRLSLLDGDGMQHDLYLPDFNAKTAFVYKIGNQAELVFEVGDKQPGVYVYYCTVPGHRQAGQEGKLVVLEP